MNFVLIVLAAIVLFVGFRWGVVAIHSGAIEKANNPPLFWLVMALTAGLLAAGLYFQVTGK